MHLEQLFTLLSTCSLFGEVTPLPSPEHGTESAAGGAQSERHLPPPAPSFGRTPSAGPRVDRPS